MTRATKACMGRTPKPLAKTPKATSTERPRVSPSMNGTRAAVSVLMRLPSGGTNSVANKALLRTTALAPNCRSTMLKPVHRRKR
eukprot:3522551-Amphidinium_carterae.1